MSGATSAPFLAPLRGAMLSGNTMNSNGFGAFSAPKNGSVLVPFWVPILAPFWLHFWLHFGLFVVPLLGQPEPPILPSLWAGLAGPWGRG